MRSISTGDMGHDDTAVAAATSVSTASFARRSHSGGFVGVDVFIKVGYVNENPIFEVSQKVSAPQDPRPGGRAKETPSSMVVAFQRSAANGRSPPEAMQSTQWMGGWVWIGRFHILFPGTTTIFQQL